MAEKGPRSHPPDISDDTRALWAAAEQRARDVAEAKSYLESTGKYTKAQLERLDYDELKVEIRDEAVRQALANDSKVDPDTIKSWINAESTFTAREQAKDYLKGTGRWGPAEIDKMTDADLRAAIDTHATNTLLGHDSAVNPAWTKLWVDAEVRFRENNPGAGDTSQGTGVGARPGGTGGTGGGTQQDDTTDTKTDDSSPFVPGPDGADDTDHTDHTGGTQPGTGGGSDTSPGTTPSTDTGSGSGGGTGGGTTEGDGSGDAGDNQGSEESGLIDTGAEGDIQGGEHDGEHVHIYEDPATGQQYGVTEDGTVIPIGDTTDAEGNPVDTHVVGEGGSTTVTGDDSDGDDDEGDDSSGDDTSGDDTASSGAQDAGGGVGYTPIDDDYHRPRTGTLDPGALTGHIRGGGDVDPVPDGEGTPVEGDVDPIFTKDKLLGGDTRDPDLAFGSGRPISALPKAGAGFTDPVDDDGFTGTGPVDEDHPRPVPSVAAAIDDHDALRNVGGVHDFAGGGLSGMQGDVGLADDDDDGGPDDDL